MDLGLGGGGAGAGARAARSDAEARAETGKPAVRLPKSSAAMPRSWCWTMRSSDSRPARERIATARRKRERAAAAAMRSGSRGFRIRDRGELGLGLVEMGFR